ncbi:hypothetical protein XHC_0369 [Xanthomonas hortorum pv. carotae str. M081]|nr:hypothetical protein XHC_0369 [Xanthomonas hortorum pv. carotae str. M081]
MAGGTDAGVCVADAAHCCLQTRAAGQLPAGASAWQPRAAAAARRERR